MVNPPPKSAPIKPDRRAVAIFGAAVFLFGLITFGLGFGYPILQALHHQPGVITIHPQLLLLSSCILVMGTLILGLAIFNAGADFGKKSPVFWKVVLVISMAALWGGSWIELVDILRRLGYP